MIELSAKEKNIFNKIMLLKEQAGSHSPNIFTMKKEIPEITINVDACFLSNPYATSLFIDYFNREIIDTGKLRELLEYYPSQNRVIGASLAKLYDVDVNEIFIGNGAIEIIQALLHNFVIKKIAINLPTFSAFYEFVKNDKEIVYYNLDKEEKFKFDIDRYIRFIKENNPDTVILINPNNPNGGYINYETMTELLDQLKGIETVIIDESFIHFAFEDKIDIIHDTISLYKKHSNVIIVKSMSKDFGIAGIRAGYALMNRSRCETLLGNGYLWNSNGLSEYFFNLYSRADFLAEYEKIRLKYIDETQAFFKKLAMIKEILVYPSSANFSLIELKDGSKSSEAVTKLLILYGIYTRDCSDKLGLNGEFIRIASRTFTENKKIIKSVNSLFCG